MGCELRAEAALDLMQACRTYEKLLLPTLEGNERARVQAVMDEGEKEIKRLGERMLQFARSGYSSAPANDRQGRG